MKSSENVHYFFSSFSRPNRLSRPATFSRFLLRLLPNHRSIVHLVAIDGESTVILVGAAISLVPETFKSNPALLFFFVILPACRRYEYSHLPGTGHVYTSRMNVCVIVSDAAVVSDVCISAQYFDSVLFLFVCLFHLISVSRDRSPVSRCNCVIRGGRFKSH